jgi:hypothetical protein
MTRSGRVASELLGRLGGDWPRRWYDPTDLQGEEDELSSLRPDERWFGVERVLTKQSWLDGEADAPIWPLHEEDAKACSRSLASRAASVARRRWR